MNPLEAIEALLKKHPGRRFTKQQILSWLVKNAPTRRTEDSRKWLIVNCTTNAKRNPNRKAGFYDEYGYNLLFKEESLYRRYVKGEDAEPLVR